MSLTVSIARRDIYTADGRFDTSLYEIQTNSDGEFIQDLQLESAAELVLPGNQRRFLRKGLGKQVCGNCLQRWKCL